MSSPAGFFPFELTPAERTRAAWIALFLEDARREQNRRDADRAARLELLALERAFEASHER